MCFGDSNTYGAIPTLARVGRHRFAPDRRWPGIMRRQLGSGWEVLEEGHPGRTTVHDDPIEGLHKNGLKALPVCLETHMPLDLVDPHARHQRPQASVLGHRERYR